VVEYRGEDGRMIGELDRTVLIRGEDCDLAMGGVPRADAVERDRRCGLAYGDLLRGWIVRELILPSGEDGEGGLEGSVKLREAEGRLPSELRINCGKSLSVP
jgi:hypothetical protein